MDGAIALQPADGAAPTLEPDARVRVGVLPARHGPVRGTTRDARHGVQVDASVALPPDVLAVDGVPHRGARLDAGAEPPRAVEPRLRRLPADGAPQRLLCDPR